MPVVRAPVAADVTDDDLWSSVEKLKESQSSSRIGPQTVRNIHRLRIDESDAMRIPTGDRKMRLCIYEIFHCGCDGHVDLEGTRDSISSNFFGMD